MYLFTTAAISQLIPPCRKGSFHASIPDLFPPPSCRAEWSHFLDARAVPLGYGNAHHRWCWCLARRGRQHHAWSPGSAARKPLREGALRLCSATHAPIRAGGTAESSCPGTLLLTQSTFFPVERQCLCLDEGASKQMCSVNELSINPAEASN